MENKLVLQQKEKSLTVLRDAEKFVASNLPSQISNADEYKLAGKFLVAITDRLKKATALKMKVSREFEAWKRIGIIGYVTAISNLTQARELTEQKMEDFRIADRQEREEAEKKISKIQMNKRLKERKAIEQKIEQLEEIGDTEGAHFERKKLEQFTETVPAVVAMPEPEAEGVSIRHLPKWRIVDASKIPAEYWMLDEVKIGKVVRASSGTIKIDGIEIYFEESTSVRTQNAEIEDAVIGVE